MKPRLLALGATATAVATSVLVTAGPAMASGPTDLFDRDAPGLTVMETLGLFVLAPLVLFGVIALVVLGPSMGKGPRHRTGAPLDTGPVWVDPSGAADEARTPAGATQGSTDRAPHQGGASGHW